MAKVITIPATINPLTYQPLNSNAKRRVCAYARVSTDSKEQEESYEAQVKAYTRMINEHSSEWEYVGIYADEGLTGTMVKNRKEFKRMIEDCKAGKIDLILCKSTSRFSRNVLDSISHVRLLKSMGIEVYFEKENMWTLQQSSEFVLTVMCSIAQEESRSISANVTIGKRWSMEQGHVSWAYSNFLGYKKTENGIEIIPEQAEVVRQIYRWFLVEGKSCSEIASLMNFSGVPTPSERGKKWTVNNITSIITNEKYAGDAILQKTYIPDYLTHKPRKNKGELKMYHVTDSHPAIIDKEEWELAQAEFKRRQGMHGRYSANSIFAARLVCADCGSFYGKKVWHSNTAHRKEMFQCNSKFKKEKPKCETPSLSEETIKELFIEAFNNLFKEKDNVIQDCELVKVLLTDISPEDKIIEEANVEMDIVSELVKKLINSNSTTAQDQTKYQERYNELSARYEKAKKTYEDAVIAKGVKRDKSKTIERFIDSLQEIDGPLIEWSDSIWISMIDKAIVDKDFMEFQFKNGKKEKVMYKKSDI